MTGGVLGRFGGEQEDPKQVNMRVISVLMAGAVLASCTTGPQPPPMRTAERQQEYDRLLLGKVPQSPVSCLPHYRSGDMRTIDDETILFRDGAYRTYVA